MINLELAKKIKSLRKEKALTQDELSNLTNLSLRTIQRIENGETEARGDTLKRLANALEVTPNDLITWVEHEDRGYLSMLNLSALSFVAYPILGIVLPLALWILKRDKVKYADEMGKRLINFQLTWCLLIGLWYSAIILTMLFHNDVRIPNFGIRTLNRATGLDLLIIAFPILLYIYNLIIIVVNSIRSYQYQEVVYQPAIRFIK